MAERLRRLWHVLGGLLGRLFRGLGRLLTLLGHFLSRQWRLYAVARGQRAEVRRRAEILENLGKMVYLLYKRNLVRNADLLAECEKIVAIDSAIDGLGQQADAIRALRAPAPSSPPVDVASVPLEVDRLAADSTEIPESQGVA